MQYRGAAYPLLAGKGLRAVIVGKAFSFPETEGVVTAPRCQGFHEDGAYFQCGDRVRIIPGRYVVEHDRVCATTGSYTLCFQVFGSAQTRYFVRHLRDAAPFDEPVCIRPLKEEATACR